MNISELLHGLMECIEKGAAYETEVNILLVGDVEDGDILRIDGDVSPQVCMRQGTGITLELHAIKDDEDE
jgi:hypothetical protein